MKSSGNWLKVMVVLFAGMLLAGCETTTPAGPGPTGGPRSENPIMNVGDTVLVTFQDLTPQIAPVEQAVNEDGRITLIYNKSFLAAGKTAGQLALEIHDYYVPEWFKNMTPTVTIKERFFSVTGEVKMNGRQVYIGRMTVLQGIATAGGFGEFANKTKIYIIRGTNKPVTINAVKALTDPKQNVEIFPGDIIHVPKRWL